MAAYYQSTNYWHFLNFKSWWSGMFYPSHYEFSRKSFIKSGSSLHKQLSTRYLTNWRKDVCYVCINSINTIIFVMFNHEVEPTWRINFQKIRKVKVIWGALPSLLHQRVNDTSSLFLLLFICFVCFRRNFICFPRHSTDKKEGDDETERRRRFVNYSVFI